MPPYSTFLALFFPCFALSFAVAGSHVWRYMAIVGLFLVNLISTCFYYGSCFERAEPGIAYETPSFPRIIRILWRGRVTHPE